MCVAYRPPDTTIAEFSGLIQCLDNTLSALPAPTPNIILMGDFNFNKHCIQWNHTEDGLHVPVVAKHREQANVGGKQDRLQAQQLVDLADKYCLLQEVDQPTHQVEILDLIFTNNSDLVGGIYSEEWRKFTDHNLVLAYTSFDWEKNNSNDEEQFLCKTGRRYSALDFNKAPWEEICDQLSLICWDPMQVLATSNPSEALSWFHDQVLCILEKIVPKKSKRPKSRHRMHRMRRLLWRRLAKVRRSLKKAKSTNKISELLDRMWKLEEELSQDFIATNNKTEDDAVFEIKSNSKYFFSFAKYQGKSGSLFR